MPRQTLRPPSVLEALGRERWLCWALAAPSGQEELGQCRALLQPLIARRWTRHWKVALGTSLWTLLLASGIHRSKHGMESNGIRLWCAAFPLLCQKNFEKSLLP